MKDILLSIVIPCYNEEKNIRDGKIKEVIDYFERKNYRWELLIVDDESTDGSLKLLKKIIKNHKNLRLLENTHQGKAGTVIAGMLEAKGKYILFTDLDQATPIREIEKFLPFFDSGYDIVIGSRYSRRKGAPFLRAIMGPAFTLIRKALLGMSGISDTQCGFKAFKKEVAQNIFTRLKLYKQKNKVEGSQVTAGFDVELLYLAQKLGYKIKEVPVSWHYVETRRVSPLRDSYFALLDLVKIRWNSMRGLYNT